MLRGDVEAPNEIIDYAATRARQIIAESKALSAEIQKTEDKLAELKRSQVLLLGALESYKHDVLQLLESETQTAEKIQYDQAQGSD